MPTGWYTRRREERQFRPQQAQPFGQMAVQWLTWEAAKNGCAIRHQVNGREKRIGKLPVDGWCPETRTAYQFHGCFFHGCPKCYDQNETNSMNGKTMATLLEKTRCNTAYLRRHVEVVEMWECEWKEIRNESVVKTFLAPASRPQMDHDAAGDHRRSGRWHTVRYGRMRRPRPRRTARLLFRNAACVQERERHSR